MKPRILGLVTLALAFTVLGVGAAAADPCVIPNNIDRWKANVDKEVILLDKSGRTHFVTMTKGATCFTTQLSDNIAFESPDANACLVRGDKVKFFRGNSDDYTATCTVDFIDDTVGVQGIRWSQAPQVRR